MGKDAAREFVMTIDEPEDPSSDGSDSDDFEMPSSAPASKSSKKAQKPAAGGFAFDDDGDLFGSVSNEPVVEASSLRMSNTALKIKERKEMKAALNEKWGKKKGKEQESSDDDDDDDDDDDEEEDDDSSDAEMEADDEEDDEDAEEDDEEDDEEDEDEEDEEVDGEVMISDTKASKKKKASSTSSTSSTSSSTSTQPLVAHFSQLKLSRPLIRAVAKMGFTKPTPVQAASIPPGMAGRDLMVNAMTGSGKTAAFMLPCLERLIYRPRRVAVTRVLVITPTRELATQIMSMTRALAEFTDIRVGLVVGGLSMVTQETELRSRPDIVVATPGRLIDHLRNSQSVHLEDVEVLILDEADRLLELGFQDEIRELVSACPRGRQTLLFSATLSENINDLVELSLNNPVKIAVNSYNKLVDRLTQEFIRVKQPKKSKLPGPKKDDKESPTLAQEAIVLSLCKRNFHSKTIIFVASKALAHRLMLVFGFADLNAAELHGNLTQAQRLEALQLFRDGEVNFLICTDLASRGLDIKGVETVINMSMPREYRQYVHRVGRTARAGRKGRAVSLIEEHERKMLKDIVKRSTDAVQSREVPGAVVKQFKSMISDMNDDIEAVLSEEKMEKAARVAEMEANKAANMMAHEAEIYSRPKRTWFQSESERLNNKLNATAVNGLSSLVAKQQAKDKEEELKREKKEAKEARKKADPYKGMSRQEKRKRMLRDEHAKEMVNMRKDLEREYKDLDPQARARKIRQELPPDAKSMKLHAKAAKKSTLPPPEPKGNDLELPKKKSKKKKRKAEEEIDLKRPNHQYSSNDRDVDQRWAPTKKSKSDIMGDAMEAKRKKNKKARDGKSNKAFKSKARFVRR